MNINGQWMSEYHDAAPPKDDHVQPTIVADLDQIPGAPGVRGRIALRRTVELEGEDHTCVVDMKALGEVKGSQMNGVAAPAGRIFSLDGLPIAESGYSNSLRHLLDLPNHYEISAEPNGPGSLMLHLHLPRNSLKRNIQIFELQKPESEKYKQELGHGADVHKEVQEEPFSWEQFKSLCVSTSRPWIYRGQSGSWPLRTSFHRHSRADLHYYRYKSLVELERHISSISGRPYDLDVPRDWGALLNIAQHHGYPTPFLDWSHSPYVAAFFAFENEGEVERSDGASIFMLDPEPLARRTFNAEFAYSPIRTVKVVSLPPDNNPRVIPQQSVTMFSNVSDIERYLAVRCDAKGISPDQVIRHIRIPRSDRLVAMRELSMMGITWGSLMPGLDGVCKEMAIRHFDDNARARWHISDTEQSK